MHDAVEGSEPARHRAHVAPNQLQMRRRRECGRLSAKRVGIAREDDDAHVDTQTRDGPCE